jgi:hypothetical protein
MTDRVRKSISSLAQMCGAQLIQTSGWKPVSRKAKDTRADFESSSTGAEGGTIACQQGVDVVAWLISVYICWGADAVRTVSG